MSTTMPDLPFGAQLIGRTEKSLDAFLKRILRDSGLSEPEYVALRVSADHEGESRADLIAHLTGAFRKGDDHAAQLVDALERAGLLESGEPATVALTAAGSELHRRLVGETDALTVRLWGDLPASDLAVAARVLSEVVRRAANEAV